MDSLFAKLNKEDIEKIDAYRMEFGDVHKTSYGKVQNLSHILRYWEIGKETLYKLLGNNFILKKDVNIQANNDVLCAEMESILTHDFIKTVKNKVHYRHLSAIINTVNLVENSIWIQDDILVGDKIVPVCPDMKLMKVLSKFASILNIEDLFEDFRIAHSRILNTKTVKGRLCLSIHPLDYMTMSDNTFNWTSCMSWQGEGCYRLGTVEMMNSPMVIVAYLENDKTLPILKLSDGDMTWNSKRWRELFVVNENIITGIKPYPYQCDDLEMEILIWLRQLAEKNMGWNFYDKVLSFNSRVSQYNQINLTLIFCTEFMYNDFYRRVHTAFISPNCPTIYECNYSGPAVCMKCGGTKHMSFDNENTQLCCAGCTSGYVCDICNRFYFNSINYLEDGREVCDECLNTKVKDFITGEELSLADAIRLSFVNWFNPNLPFRYIQYISKNTSMEDFQALFKKVQTMSEDWFKNSYNISFRLEELTDEWLEKIIKFDF